MPVINGVYLKDFPALPSSVVDANIIPIAESGNQVAYRTTVGGIVTDARVTGKVLTGLSVTGGAIASTDTILQAFGKVQNQLNNRVTSVGLSMPSAFTVTNSPVTGTGTLTVTGAGLASQYIRGDGQLADFPTGGGGGSSVSYYLNGSVNQGTFSGDTYYEMNKNAILGAGTDFTISADGYIASFITDANDPNLLLIPGGNWNLEFYFSASSGGGSPSFYVELSKWNGSSFTAIASNSSNPELIAFGTSIQPYFATLAVPETVLLATDRLAIRVYVNHSGRTITLHTENNTLCQIITTFTTGLQSLNGLTKQTQFFSVGTSGTDFNISSVTDTHTFNIPSASDTNRGLVTTGTQTFAGEKTFFNGLKSLNTLRVDLSSTPNTTGLYSNTSGTGRALYAEADTGNAAWLYNFGTGNEVLRVEVGNLTGALATFRNTGGQVVLISNAGNITANSFIKSGGTSSQFLKADGSVDGTAYGTGSVTSVSALTLGTSGTDLSSTVANGTTTPVITLNVPTASATNRGALSSTDWTTFNSKQNAITLTTVGTSGAATLIGSTLNIPNYADGGVLSLSAIGSSPNANGGTITGTVLNLEPASASFGGVVTTGTQTFAGAKTFTSPLTSNSFIPTSNTAPTNGMYLSSPNELAFSTDGTNRLKIAENGKAIFSGIIEQLVGTANSLLTTTAGSGLEIRSDGSTAADRNIAFKLGTTVQGQIYNSGNWFIGSSPTDAGYKLDVNGTGRFSGALSGTSATFSASATNPLAITNTGGRELFNVNTTLDGGFSTFRSSGTVRGYIGNGAGISGASESSFGMRSESDLILMSGGNNIRATITSGGNVGINTTTPTPFLNANSKTLDIYSTGANPSELALTGQSANLHLGNGSTAAYIYSTGAYPLLFGTNGAERMRITSGGDLLVAKTATNFAVLGCELKANGRIASTMAESTNAMDTLDVYSTGAAAYRFYVQMDGKVNATNTTIAAISDIRLKENIQDIDVGLKAILSLKPRKFDWKDGKGKNIKGDRGWIAQEFEEVFPEMIGTWKDTPPEGEEPYKSVAADLIPILVKSIQELNARIIKLESK